jgi:formylglycine-generating enzyme
MKTVSHAVRIGLSALVLVAGVAAHAAAPVITNITMVGVTPRFSVRSDVGSVNQIQYSTNLSQTNWLVLTNLLVAQTPYLFVDASAPPSPRRFYRVLAQAVPTNMAFIPAGTFTMGNCMDPGEGASSELPLHSVYVSAFFMDKNLVSYAFWQQVYQWATNHGYSFDYDGSGKAATHPVQSIDWYDCAKWCNARSQMEGRTPAYYTDAAQTLVYRSGQVNLATNWVKWSTGYRLPTEAEWEKAARGGASGHRFPWSDADTIDWSRANYNAFPAQYSYDVNPISGYDTNYNSGAFPYTSPVGSLPANGYGLYDMAGNVWEWCWDWFDSNYYGSSPGSDPRGPASGPNRVLRGGSWSSVPFTVRSAYRNADGPYYSYYYFGFRCVRGP